MSQILVKALIELRGAFIIAVGDTSPFAKCALEKVDEAIQKYSETEFTVSSTSFDIEILPGLNPIKFVDPSMNAPSKPDTSELLAEVAAYLAAAADGSMSRNNSEQLAAELLKKIQRHHD